MSFAGSVRDETSNSRDSLPIFKFQEFREGIPEFRGHYTWNSGDTILGIPGTLYLIIDDDFIKKLELVLI
jgi:hypothetical protein